MERAYTFLLLLLLLITTKGLKTSDRETVDCVELKKQPALVDIENVILRNHKIQDAPSEYPKAMIKSKSKRLTVTHQAYFSTARCPEGTIPVPSDQVPMARSSPGKDYTSGHEYATASTTMELYGTKATINVWKPKVKKGADETSISQIWISSGDYKTNDLNTIEVGWQVYPNMYMDDKPRLFLYWTSDGYNNTGCYNLECPGFIQISNRVVIGGPISSVSSYGGPQFEITVLVWRDRKSGNWWLSLDGTLVGYWASEIFTTLADHAGVVEWGGEITDSHTSLRHTETQMGSGRFPIEGFGNASYFRNLEVVDSNNSLQHSRDLSTTDTLKSYGIEDSFTDDWGSHFYYGGPGRSSHSGAVRSTFSLSFLSFILCFSFIAIL